MNTQEVLQLLQDVAEEVINPRFRSLTDDQVAEKNPGDLVTVADHEAEVRITEALSRAYPGRAGPRRGGHRHRRHAAGRGSATPTTPSPSTRSTAPRTSSPAPGTTPSWSPSSAAARWCAAGSGSRSTARRTSPSAASAPGATASGWSGRPSATLLRGVTSRRRWIGRSLDGLPPLELTWVCCGVDYPKLVEGAADYLVYAGTSPGTTPRARCCWRRPAPSSAPSRAGRTDPGRAAEGLVAR